MSELTLDDETALNQLLANNEMRKGTIRVIPFSDNIHFIKIANPDNPFKMPVLMKSVETHKAYTNKSPRITKVLWVMDLVNGQRVVSYPNPCVRKILNNNRLESEIKLNSNSALVPSNVKTLWRLDAIYVVEDGKEVYDHAEMRKYQ